MQFPTARTIAPLYPFAAPTTRLGQASPVTGGNLLVGFGGVAAPVSPPRGFLLLTAVLVLLALYVDLTIGWPFTDWAATTLVVVPVEKEWGFHAEWRPYPSRPHYGELLTVVSIVPGGAFDRSGIKAGYAFAPRTCAFGAPFFADGHSRFLGSEPIVHARMLAPSGPLWPEPFTIRRPTVTPGR